MVRSELVRRLPVRGLTLRVLGAASALGLYLLLRRELDPAALVAARFGLGLALFALLVDVGRAAVGIAPPVHGGFHRHSQRAQALVDDDYRRVHGAVRAYIDHGRWTPALEQVLTEALEARDVPASQQQDLLDHARAAARERPGAHRPLALSLFSGLVIVLGAALTLAVLLEALGASLGGPVTAVVGLGLYLLQARAVGSGSRWGTALTGLTGALVVFLGASAAGGTGGPWALVEFLAAVMALATVGLVAVHRFEAPPWPEVRERLERDLSTLRRAFLATLLGALVLFPFKPLLEQGFTALGWPFDVPYRMAVVGYATIALFLALELVSAWYALDQGARTESRQRRARVEATWATLDHDGLPGGDP